GVSSVRRPPISTAFPYTTLFRSVLDYAPAMLPADRPRYLMGVGKPVDLVEAVWRGVDMFDCVLPTRAGRHGQAWTWAGPINLKRSEEHTSELQSRENLVCRLLLE